MTGKYHSLAFKITQSYYYLDAFYYLTRAKKNPVKICDSKKLIEFLAEIQVIDPESIIKQATLQELEPLCK